MVLYRRGPREGGRNRRNAPTQLASPKDSRRRDMWAVRRQKHSDVSALNLREYLAHPLCRLRGPSTIV